MRVVGRARGGGTCRPCCCCVCSGSRRRGHPCTAGTGQSTCMWMRPCLATRQAPKSGIMPGPSSGHGHACHQHHDAPFCSGVGGFQVGTGVCRGGLWCTCHAGAAYAFTALCADVRGGNARPVPHIETCRVEWRDALYSQHCDLMQLRQLGRLSVRRRGQILEELGSHEQYFGTYGHILP